MSLKALSVTIILLLTGAMLARVKPEDFGMQEKTH
jgi:hypothetical protein